MLSLKKIFSYIFPFLIVFTFSSLLFSQKQITPFKISTKISKNKIKVGESFTITVTANIPKEHYIYKDMTSLKMELNNNIIFEEPKFPQPKVIHDKFTDESKEVFDRNPLVVTIKGVAISKIESTIIKGVFRYQGCNPTLCYFPTNEPFEFKVEIIEKESSSSNDLFEKGYIFAFFFAFLGGFLTSLTPCVYPLIPITVSIFGAKDVKSKFEGFLLSLTYVLGIAIMYSSLGIIAAMTGSIFGSFMTNPYVIGVISLIFVLLAFSMFGFYEIQLPVFLQTKLSSVGGKGYISAFLMGLVSGVVAAPCTGPVLASILTYVATTQNILLGFSLLFTFSLGMGVLFIVLGVGAVSFLPKSGSWMESIKKFFGIVFIGAALYFLKNVIPSPYIEIILGSCLIILATFLGAFIPLTQDSKWTLKLKKSLSIISLSLGLSFLIIPLFLQRVTLNEISQNKIPTEAKKEVLPSPSWIFSEEEGLKKASSEKKPVMIDFYADWCVACKELDKFVYSNPNIIEESNRFINIKIDFTRTNKELEELKKKYEIVGLPKVIFISSEGKIMNDLTVTGFIPAEKFMEILKQVK